MTRRRHFGSAFSALALLAAGATILVVPTSASYAQDYTNVTASGRVVDAAGAGIANATVVAKSNTQGFERSATTDSSGSYRIPQIPAGSYTFTVSGPNGGSFIDPGVNLTQDSSGNTFELAATSSAATDSKTAGEIVVTGRRVRVADFERTTTGMVINVADLASRVPVARDISSVVQLSPGTTQGDAGFGNLPNIAGSSVAENAFFLNGLNITNFRTGLGAVTIPFDFYQAVEVKNGGFQAEFGRATGGVVNATTKSGGNEFHGNVLFNWTPDSLRSKQRNTLTQDNDADERDRTDTVMELSGPIIKDRLFFYGLYNFRNVVSKNAFQNLANGNPKSPTFTGNRYEIDTSDDPFYGAKIDGIITDGHRVEFTYFNTSATMTRSTFGTASQARLGGRYNPVTNAAGGFDSTTVFRSGGENYVGRYTGTFAPWLTVSGAYGVNNDRDTTESTTSNRSSIIDERSGTPIQIGNPTSNSELNKDRREFYRGDVDVFFDLLGSHHIRGGYDRENLKTDIITLANGGGQLTYSNGSATNDFGFTSGTYLTNRFFRNGGTFKSKNEAFYIQDNWALFSDGITLQIGIRNDKFTNKTIDGTPYYKSGDQWGPRLGFTADPFGDGRTKVYGSFGRYFLPIAASTNNRLGGAELDYDRFFALNGVNADGTPILGAQLSPAGGQPCPTGAGNCIIRNDGAPGNPQSLISRNLKSQSLDEYIIGADRRIGSRLRVGMFFTKRDLNETLEDAAVDTAIRAYCVANNLNGANADGASCAGTGGTGARAGTNAIFDGTHQYVLLNPGAPGTITFQDAINGEKGLRTVDFDASALGIPKAVRKYRSVTLQVEREFDGVWGLSGSYTWSTLRGNTEGGVRSDNDQDDTGATVDFDLPGLADGTYGYSPNHRRHNLKLYGSYKVAEWLTLGANGSLVSPRKFGCLGTVPASRDAAAATFYGANGTYCNLSADGSIRTTPFAAGEVRPARQIVQRGTAFEGDWQYTIDLDAQIKVPTDLFNGFLRVSVLNVLNSKANIDFEERGTLSNGDPRAIYGTVTQYQAPRSVRLQFGVGF